MKPTISDTGIFIPGGFKALVVFVVVAFAVWLSSEGEWYKGLLVMNISLHYREFLEFFSDFSDEYYSRDKKLKETLNTKSPGPNNIRINKSYDKYYNKVYGEVDIDNKLTNELRNIKKENFTGINDEYVNDMYDMELFSQIYDERNKRIVRRSNEEYPNDDIKLMSHVDLNHGVPWWQLSDGFN